MNTHFRDLFGSRAATLAALAEIRDRVERLETAPVPDLPPSVDARLTDLSRRDADQQDHIDTNAENVAEIIDRFDGLDGWRKEIVIAVGEGIERTDRAERRIKASVQRARKQLESLGYVDDGLESEAVDLRLIDGDGSERGGVPPVPAEVANAQEESSSVRGVPLETLKRARGY